MVITPFAWVLFGCSHSMYWRTWVYNDYTLFVVIMRVVGLKAFLNAL